MPLLRAAIIAIAIAGSACSRDGAAGQAKRDAETLHVGTQAVPLLRSDAPIDVVLQQFRLSEARAMSNGITQLVTMRDRPDVAALVSAAWRSDRQGHPDFNWAAIETPTVRLAIAGVLGQWSADKTEYHAFAVSQLDAGDPMTRIDAVIALGSVANPDDAVLFEKLAKGSDETLATAALGALQIMGTPESLRVIEAVSADAALPAARKQQAQAMLTMPHPSK